MIQLTYEPAFDPLHSMFRALRLREAVDASLRVPRDLYRILDFYLLFPQRLGEARLRQEHRGLKTRAAQTSRAPPYGPRPEDAVLFERIRPFQEAALDTLARHGFFSAEALEDGWVVPESKAPPDQLIERIEHTNTDEADLMRALGTIAAGYALDGTNGLKDRTGLLEHRYDAV
jgi:hypothetical protein